MNNPLILSGDENIPDLAMTDAQVNHLRLLLGWLRLEYTLDEDMQRGYLQGAALGVAHGLCSLKEANALLQSKADEINKVPAYVRHAHRMLDKALKEHDRTSRIVDEGVVSADSEGTKG